jgi:hypothetical protein
VHSLSRLRTLPEEERMKITVCEFPDEAPRKEAAWVALVRFLQASPSAVPLDLMGAGGTLGFLGPRHRRCGCSTAEV